MANTTAVLNLGQFQIKVHFEDGSYSCHTNFVHIRAGITKHFYTSSSTLNNYMALGLKYTTVLTLIKKVK